MKPRRKKRSLDPNTIVIIKQIILGLFIFAGVAMLLITVWYGTRATPLTIAAVEVSGGETVKPELVRALVEAELAGAYLGIVPRRFAWLYPRQAIYEAVYSLDRVHTVQLERSGGTVLTVSFTEHTPAALWCDSVESTDCYFMNEQGYAFAKAPSLSGGSLLRFVEVGQEPVRGEYIAEAVVIDTAVALVGLLQQQAWTVSHVEVAKGGDVFLRIVGGGELKVDLGLSPEQTVDNLQTILSSEEFSHVEPGNFQYIDLRFGNKVFVNEELALPDAAASSSPSEMATGTSSSVTSEPVEQVPD